MEVQVHSIHGIARHNDYTDLLQAAEQGTAELTEVQLRAAASTIEDGERHVRLSTDLRYILINTTTGAAATVCRQYQHTIGFEMYRQLCIRFSIPLGTRSIGHLTRLLKPTFDKNNFEESFSTWEFELQRFERDNGQTLPDSVKIAVLLNETSGPLQQHLQLLSGQSPNYARVKLSTTLERKLKAQTCFRTPQGEKRVKAQDPSFEPHGAKVKGNHGASFSLVLFLLTLAPSCSNSCWFSGWSERTAIGSWNHALQTWRS